MAEGAGLYEQVIPYVPAFLTYEKGLVEWFGTIIVPRDDSHNVRFKIEYAGGEKAVRAIRALKEVDSRNERGVQPVITIKLGDVVYNNARYHPPESSIGTLWDGPKRLARRAARISKPSPWRLTYAIEIHSNFEVDLRYATTLIINRFHHHGGLSYLVRPYPINGVDPRSSRREFFPLWLKSYVNATENGEQERVVKASMVFELEAYLALPFHYVPTFRKYYQNIVVKGSPEEESIGETVLLNPSDNPTFCRGGLHGIPTAQRRPGMTCCMAGIQAHYQLQADCITWNVVGVTNPHGTVQMRAGSNILDSVPVAGATRWMVQFRKGSQSQTLLILASVADGVATFMEQSSLQTGSGTFDVSVTTDVHEGQLRFLGTAGSTGWSAAWERLASIGS